MLTLWRSRLISKKLKIFLNEKCARNVYIRRSTAHTKAPYPLRTNMTRTQCRHQDFDLLHRREHDTFC